MDLMTSPSFKNKYQKYKIRVKRWESHFMEERGRKPKKDDIKEADINIREAYKCYWKMKTKALEETLINATFSEDDFNSLDVSTSVSDIFNKTPSTPATPTNSEELVSPEVKKTTPSTCTAEPDVTSSPLTSQETCRNTNAKGAWGAHLNHKRPTRSDGSSSFTKSSSFQLSQKMFKSSLSKRNPRKSLSTSKLRNDSLDSPNVSFSQPSESSTPDEGADVKEVEEKLDQMFESTFNVVNTKKEPEVKSSNTIKQLIEGKINTCKREFNEGWLKRSGVETHSTILSEHNTLDNVVSEPKTILQTQSAGNKQIAIVSSEEKAQYTSDEDFICNSDSEEERKKKRIRNPSKMPNDFMYHDVKRACIKENVNNFSFNHLTYSTPNNLMTNDTVEKKSSVINVPIVSNEMTFNDAGPHLSNGPNALKPLALSDDDDDEDEIVKKKPKKKRITSKTKKESRPSDTEPKKPAPRTASRRNSRRLTVQNDESEENHSYEETLETHPRLMPNLTETGERILPRFGSISFDHVATASKNTSTNSDLPAKAGSKNDKKSSLNDNYVRLNLKKKIFVRGKKAFNYTKYKKALWKQAKNNTIGNLDLADNIDKNGGKLICFKCGNAGHFSRRCPNQKGTDLLPLTDEVDEVDPSNPTLAEAEIMAKPSTSESISDAIAEGLENIGDADELTFTFEDFEEEMLPASQQQQAHSNNGQQLPQYVLDKLAMQPPDFIEPVYPLESDGSVKDTPLEILQALMKFGHTSFRPGQEEAIMRILSGLSTLVTLSTGAGKSLCYQLPAYIYAQRSSCITLVISPLVSLMDDQVSGIPSCLSAACLHTSQTKKVRDKVIERIQQRTLQVLLVSPEAILSGEKSYTFGSIFRQLPPIAFACIDEVHCLSQWSHNFRPSYLMLCKILKEKLKVKTILGLTATATRSTVDSIMKHLDPRDGLNGVISDTPLPNNLHLSISRDNDRELALIRLLKSSRFEGCDSIIVYCTRREECNRVAGLLRTSFQNLQSEAKANPKVSPIAESYHAGLTAYRRKLVQGAFMAGNIRIVVATIAFGMGINKSNIRSVIHYNMPAHFEGYVQEIGRAGRDGLDSHCHLFLNPKENVDKFELRRHIFANGLDRPTIRELLSKIFQPCSCTAQSQQRCRGHEVAVPIDETVETLDITEETIATLLCYLELHPKRYVTVASTGYTVAKITSYNGPQALKLAAKMCPPLAAAMQLGLKNGSYNESSNKILIPVIEVASLIGYDSGFVKNQLKRLEWTNVNGKPKRTTINVELEKLGFITRAPGDLSDEELDDALNALENRCKTQERLSLYQLEAIASTSRKFSVPKIEDCLELNDDILSKSEEMKALIRSYFKQPDPTANMDVNFDVKLENEENVVADVRGLISAYHDNNFTGRAVARIFHGIQSPNYSALVWSRCKYWRAHLSEDFNAISRKASAEILNMR